MRAAVAVAVLAVVAGLSALAFAAAPPGRIGPALHIVNLGRHLTPYGKQVEVGNVPMGAAVTPDGRYYWTVSAGAGFNDVRIVSVNHARVIQTIKLPGASGGVAIDPRGGKAYVSGIANSTNQGTSRPRLPGGKGDVIHVFKYSQSSGRAHETRRIKVPPPSDAPNVEDFPAHRAPIAYPEHLAVSGDGHTLLVPLGLSDAAAVVGVKSHVVRYVGTGHYPYGAAIFAHGTRGLVSNESPGTVSVINLRNATKIRDIKVGNFLSHPEAIVARGRWAFVTVTNRDYVAAIDLKSLKVVAKLSTKTRAGVGSAPDGVALTPSGGRV